MEIVMLEKLVCAKGCYVGIRKDSKNEEMNQNVILVQTEDC